MINPISAAQPIYEAESSVMQTIHRCRDKLHLILRQHMNRRVQVTTVHGHMYEGTITSYDEHYLYLDISMPEGDTRQFYPGAYPFYYDPYYSTILPLVLFELLTIALLY